MALAADRLNPFLIRASFERIGGQIYLGTASLNPFLIRASFESDLDLEETGEPGCLNPFLIRASFESALAETKSAGYRGVLIPS